MKTERYIKKGIQAANKVIEETMNLIIAEHKYLNENIDKVSELELKNRCNNIEGWHKKIHDYEIRIEMCNWFLRNNEPIIEEKPLQSPVEKTKQTSCCSYVVPSFSDCCKL